MNKPGRLQARPLADLLHKTLKDAFAKHGFAATELVTRWAEIAGSEIAAHCEPERIVWARRPAGDEEPLPGTLVLRVEGPTAIEIQHLSRLILERVNGFFGWQAVAELRLRQAPLSRRERRALPPPPDPAEAERIAASLPDISDERLRAALGRLGAAVKQG
jgi:hypothetical protein